MDDRDLVVEAVTEDVAAKLAVLGALDDVVRPDTVLATKTSSIPIIDLAMATSRADKVVGLHFYNPVPVMSLVEVVPSLKTSAAAKEAVTDFVAWHWANKSSRHKTAPGSSSTRFSSPTCSPRSECSSPDLPQQAISTPGCAWAAPIQWVRWSSPT